ncbi:MAG: ATP/GTP-binding protein, partial [Fervidicoccaceae archaeon]
ISMLLLSYSVSLRHSFPQINAITKVDTLDREHLDELYELRDDPTIIIERVSELERASTRELIESFANLLLDVGFDFVPVSSTSEEGLEELFGRIQGIISEMNEFESNI